MNTIYIVTLEGEPQSAYTDINKVLEECTSWFEKNYDNYFVSRKFDHWCEDRDYPNTDEGYEQAWNDFISEEFETGVWGDYAWYELTIE